MVEGHFDNFENNYYNSLDEIMILVLIVLTSTKSFSTE